MKKLFISVVILCMCVSVGYAEWADGGPFGATTRFLKRALSTASNPWEVLYVDTIYVSGSGERITGTTYSEYIDFDDAGDDYIRFGGSGGSSDITVDISMDTNCEIDPSGGDLELCPDAQGDVVLFSDTDVGDESNSKSLIIHRKAAEGDTTLVLKIDSNGQSFIESASTLRISGVSRIDLNRTAVGDVECFRITDIADVTEGNSFLIHRKAVEGDSSVDIYWDQAGLLRFDTNMESSWATPVVVFNSAIGGTPDEITATGETVAASIATLSTEVTTNDDNDLDDVSLANGVSGQIKNIYCVASFAGDTWKITPANMLGGTQISFGDNSVGNGCVLVYADNEGWIVVGNNGGTVS